MASPAVAAQSPGFVLSLTVPQMEQAARIDSNDAAAHYNLALGYWNYVRYDDAVAQLRLASRLDPDFAPPYVAMFAITYAEWPDLWDDPSKLPDSVQRRGKEADQMLGRASITDPMVDLRTLGAALPPVPAWVYNNSAFYDVFLGGFQRLYEGQYQEALDQLGRVMRMFAGRDSVAPMFLWSHGIAALHLGLDSVARDDFQRLVNQAQNVARSNRVIQFPLRTGEYEYLLATTLFRMGRAPDAVVHLRNALVADAGIYTAHGKLAEIAEAGEDWDDAVAERRAAVDANPDDSRLLVLLAATLLKAGRTADAEAPVRQAVAQAPRDFEAEYVLGVVDMHLGKNAEARAALTSAVALAPRRYDVLLADARKRLSELQ